MESFGLNRLMPKQRFFARSFMTNWGHDVIMQVDQPSGACLMLRGVALKQVNYLDERFFVYLEEVDLCYRLVKQGWKVYFLPLAQVIHYGGQSSSKNLDVRIVERYRSLLRYFSKHSPLWKIVLIRMLIVFQMLLRITTLPFIRSKLSTDTAKELTILGLSSYYVRVIRSCFRSQYSI